jgi:hypothetical protein
LIFQLDGFFVPYLIIRGHKIGLLLVSGPDFWFLEVEAKPRWLIILVFGGRSVKFENIWSATVYIMTAFFILYIFVLVANMLMNVFIVLKNSTYSDMRLMFGEVLS